MNESNLINHISPHDIRALKHIFIFIYLHIYNIYIYYIFIYVAKYGSTRIPGGVGPIPYV